jgi:hypothetical protein
MRALVYQGPARQAWEEAPDPELRKQEQER